MHHAGKTRTCKLINNSARQILFVKLTFTALVQKPTYLVFFKVLATFPHSTTSLATWMSPPRYVPFL